MWKLLIASIVIFLFIPACVFAVEDDSVLNQGVEYTDICIGSGLIADMGDVVTIHLVGWLKENHLKEKEFISSHIDGKPITFKVGTERLPRGLSEGVIGMKVEGKRMITVPSKFGYGPKGIRNTVPPNADLIFEVDLLSVQKR